jgi:PAS domain S-box-containing protein
VVLAGAAFLSRQWFADQFAVSATYIFLYPAVLVTSMLAGVLPGLLATAVTVLLAALWIFPPFGALWPLATADLLSLGIYTVMAVLICLTSGYYRRMQKRIRVLETEQARRESEDRFRALADNIAQLAWMADATGARFWYNRRWFDYTGTALEQVQGWDWQQVHHPDHVRRVVDKLGSSLRDGEVWEDTFPLRGKDGSYRWFLARAVPIRNAQGEVERWFGTNTDVTDLRDAEEALRVAKEAAEEASRAKDEFLAIVSHELRTPMTVIMGALEHLLTAGPDPEQRRKLLEMADSSAHRLLGIINDLLDFTTLESHQLKIDLRPFDLRQSVRAAAEMYLRPAGEKGLRLR